MKLSVDDKEVASAWINNCRDSIEFGSVSSQAQETFWAYEMLDGLCTSDSARALRLIRMIFESNSDERVQDNLAAGPLETVLARNGVRAIPALKAEIAANPQLANLLDAVWINSMSAETVASLRAIIADHEGPRG